MSQFDTIMATAGLPAFRRVFGDAAVYTPPYTPPAEPAPVSTWVIRQEEEALKISALAENSEEEFKHDRHLYGIKTMRNVGYGYWQKACLVTFT